MICGNYEITDDFKVIGIVTDTGLIEYDPFASKEIIPTWGVYCTTYWGLNEANRIHLAHILSKEALESIQYKLFWVFWFADTSLMDQKEMFFTEDDCENPKKMAYEVLNIFNSLLETNVRRLLNQTIKDLKTLDPNSN